MIEEDSVYAIKFAVMQQQINEKDKRIKELEEHQKKFYNGELYTAKQLKQIEENQKKYFINKQRVKETIENIKERMEKEDIKGNCYNVHTVIYLLERIERMLLEDK